MSQQPQISDDGKFYWDGTRWMPLPTAAPKGPIAVQVRGQMPAWAAIAGLVVCMPIGLVMVGFTPVESDDEASGGGSRDRGLVHSGNSLGLRQG